MVQQVSRPTKERPVVARVARCPALRRRHPVAGADVVLRRQVQATPSGDGLPGGALAQKVLNWTMQVALWGSLASLLIGAAVWGISQHAGNGYQAGRGRNFAAAGAVGALPAGLSPTIVNTLFAG